MSDATELAQCRAALRRVEVLIAEADRKHCASGWPFEVDRVREAIILRPVEEETGV